MMQLFNRGAQVNVALLAGLLALGSGLAACGGNETSDLSLDGTVGATGSDEAFATPGFSCPQTRTSDNARSITLRGNFENVSGAPEITLERTADIYGEYGERQVSKTLSGSRVTRKSGSKLEIALDADLGLVPGIYDVVASTADGTTVRKETALGILPRPTVDRASPSTACLQQENDRTVAVTGGPFLKKKGKAATPDLKIGDYEVTEDDEVQATDCRDLGAAFGNFRACSRLEVSVEKGNLPEGKHSVEVTNIGTDKCASQPDADGVQVMVAPPPTLDSVASAPLCSKQQAYESLELNGSNLLRVQHQNATLRPRVTIGDKTYRAHRLDDCEQVQSSPNTPTWRCSTAFVRLEAGELDRLITKRGNTQSAHDAGSGGADAGMDAGNPDTGPPDASGPTPEYTFESLDVTLTNPDPVKCQSGNVSLSVVPPPVVHDATPDPLCNVDQEAGGGAKTVTVDGTGFVTIGAERPSVRLGDSTYQPIDIDECTDLDVQGVEATVRSCERLLIELPAGTIGTGELRDLTVQNPAPASCKSSGSAPVQTTFVPEVTGVEPNRKTAPDSQAEPVCTTDRSRTVTVYGSNFYVVDGQTPEVAFGMAGSWRADRASGCEVVNVDGRSRNVRRCSVLDVTVPQGALAPNDDAVTQAYSVTVTNPNGADCVSSSSETVFRTAAPPKIDSDGLTENFACLEEGARTFTLTGERFLRLQTGSGMTTTTRGPTVEVDGKLFEPDSVSDCSEVMLESGGNMMGPSNTVETCKELTFTIPSQRVAPTVGGSPHQVRVHQPAPVDCRGSASVPLTVDPPPTVTDVSAVDAASSGSSFQSAPTCAEQTADQLVVQGEGFRLTQDPNGEATISGMNYRVPRVTIGGTTYQAPDVSVVDPMANCTVLQDRSRGVYECSALAVDMPAGKNGLGEGTHRVSVTNPVNAPGQGSSTYGCQSRTDHQVRFTAPPTLSSIAPNPACTGRPTNTVTAMGQDFLIVDPPNAPVQRPKVTFDCASDETCGTTTRTFEAVAGRDCLRLTREAGQPPTESCEKLSFAIPEDGLPAGTYTASIENPGGNDCTSGSASLHVKSEPSVSDVQPSPVCTADNAYVVVVEGTNFLKVDGRTPSVTVGNASATVQSIRDCQTATGPSGTTIETCSKLNVELSSGSLATGAISDHVVNVTNPSPVDCRSEQNVVQKDAPPPFVSNSGNQLYEACSGGAADTMVLTGDYFFSVDGKKPSVTVTYNNVSRTYEDPTLGGNCRTLTNTSSETRKCDLMRIRLSKHSQSTLGNGTYDVGVTNPQTVQCESSGSYFLTKDAPQPPVIDDVQPTAVCSTNGQVTITGKHFQRGVQVKLGGDVANDVEYVNSNEIRASWTFAPKGPDKTLEVTNPDGCSTSATTQVDVKRGPLAVFLQPPVHYNDLLLESRLYIREGQASDVTDVRIRGPNGVVRELTFSNITGKTDQLEVTLPDEDPKNPGQKLPPGSYDLQVTEQIGSLNCGQWQENALEVVGNTDLTLTDISPQSGFRQETTDVTIRAAGNPASGKTNFLPTPRAYLDPMPNTPGEEAIPLTNDIFHTSTKITATVPDQLTPGQYRVVVINPSPGREVGILSPPDGFTVASDPAPTIDTVDPGTWITPSNPQIEVRINGQNFRVTSNQTAPVSVECKNGQPPNSITLKSSTRTELVLDFETDQMTRGDSCLLTVENPDGTTATYGPITTFNPQFDFVDFKDGPAMEYKRRGFVMESSSPTSDESFIYAIGGDNGPPPLNPEQKTYQSHAGGEFYALDAFGSPEAPDRYPNPYVSRRLPYALPAPRVFADGARIRDFVYLVGGRDGSQGEGQAQTDIYRSHVLDPEHTPTITNIEYEFEPVSKGEGGLSSGTYYYRVAAVHDGNSDHNTSGETLTSAVVPVFVPRYDEFDVQVKVTWSAGPVQNIDHYRLYRSPNPDVAVGTARMFDNRDPTSKTTSYTDQGTPAPDGKPFIRTGALGRWKKIGDLSTPRHRHKVRGIVDPSDPSVLHLYAYGGFDGSNSPLDTFERITISDDPNVDRDASVTNITSVSSPTLPTARGELAGFVASPENSDIRATNVYATGGANKVDVLATSFFTENGWWSVQNGGGLSARTNATNINQGRTGFVGVVANDYALVFGGVTPIQSEPYVEIIGTGSRSNELTNAGNITGWRSIDPIGLTPRYQHDSAAVGSFLYIGGGTTTLQITEQDVEDNNFQNVSSQEGAVTDSVEFSVIGKTRR